MGFGERLAETRKLLGMTQSDLGQGLGTDGADVGKQVVYGWEKNQHYPRVDQLILICRKLNISADYLLFGDEPPAPSKRVEEVRQAIIDLPPVERRHLRSQLADLLDRPGVPDHVVESKMPVTRRKAKDPR